MALGRPQALATACIPDLDRVVIRRRREPCRVVREGDRPDPIRVDWPYSLETVMGYGFYLLGP
jgi:hypothetical protein